MKEKEPQIEEKQLKKGRWQQEEQEKFRKGFKELSKEGNDMTTGPSDDVWKRFHEEYVKTRTRRQIQVHCKKYMNSFCRQAFPCTMDEEEVWIKCRACDNVFTKPAWTKEDAEIHKYAFICNYCKEDPMMQTKLIEIRRRKKQEKNKQKKTNEDTSSKKERMIKKITTLKKEEQREINLEAPMIDDDRLNVPMTTQQREKYTALVDDPQIESYLNKTRSPSPPMTPPSTSYHHHHHHNNNNNQEQTPPPPTAMTTQILCKTPPKGTPTPTLSPHHAEPFLTNPILNLPPTTNLSSPPPQSIKRQRDTNRLQHPPPTTTTSSLVLVPSLPSSPLKKIECCSPPSYSYRRPMFGVPLKKRSTFS